jgi:ATP-binding cassette subfamily B protein
MRLFSQFLKRPAQPEIARTAGDSTESALRQVFRSPDLRRIMPELAVASLLTNLLGLALPMAILQIMDRVVTNKSIETLIYLILGIVLALIFEEVLRSVSGLITGWLGARFEHAVSVTALERMMRVPMRRFQSEEPGAYTEKILSASRVADFYSGQSLLVLFDLPFVLIFLVVIYFIAGWLVIVPTTLLVIFSLLIVHFGRRIGREVQQRYVMDDRRLNFVAEVFANMQSVKALTMESLLLRRYERLQEANAEEGAALTHGNSMASSMGMLFSTVLIVSVIFAGAWVVIMGGMTPGGLAACMMLSVRALAPLRSTLSVWLRYQSFTAANQRLNEILELPCEVDEGKPDLPPISQALELRGISVKRGEDTSLFSALSLRVEAGQCIAIRGDSGSGKTTLMSLLSGMEIPDSGEVLVDGKSIRQFNSDSVHKQIALLPQAGTLVTGSILENMTMFDPKLESKALAIAKEMGLDQVVAGLKLGYDMPLGEGGGEVMAAGVRQLICIVRAMVQGPSVILFDEANISLDMESDTRLRKYLDKQKGSHTMVLITHRPSLLLLADKTYTLADGKLVEGNLEIYKSEAVVTDNIETLTPERPEQVKDFSIIIRQQFDDGSDFTRCLLPLLTALDWERSARALVETLPHMIRRLDLSGFCLVMSNLGLLPRHFRDTLDRLDSRFMPCLFIPTGKAAMVVLECLPNGHVRAFDSAADSIIEINRAGQEGEVYLFHKAEKGEQKPSVEAGWLSTLIWRLRRHIILAFILTILSTLLALAPPMFVMAIYDRMLTTGDVGMGFLLLLGVVIAIVLDWFLRVLKSRVMAHIGGRTEYVLGTGVFERIINLPATSTVGASVSRQLGRIKNMESLRDFFLGPLSMLAFDLPASLVMLIALAILNPWVVGVVVLSTLGFIALWYATRNLSERSSARAGQYSALRWEFLEEALTNMRAIRSVGASQMWVARFRKLSGKAVLTSFQDRQVHARISGVAQVLGMGTGILAMATSAVLMIYGSISGGAIIATMMIVWRLTGPMQSIFLAVTSMLRTRGTIRQIENLMKIPGEREGGVNQSIMPDTVGAVSFSRVSFRYANDADPALLGVTFSVRPGQMVVVTGPSGAGKSSLLKLIIRVFIPQAGTIRMDNSDIRQLLASDLRSRVSYMPQNCDIFYGSVLQNIRLVHPAATDEEVNWALEMAGLTEYVRLLPQGLDTRISNSRSEQLPRGFLQSLSLARTLLKPAPIVLMDEPGSGMDNAGERALIRCLTWLKGRSTVIIISQRPAHMMLADSVIYMERGTVSAMGTFEQIRDQIMSGLRK